jgi:hypothetical protein
MTEEEIRALRTRVDSALQRQKVNEMPKKTKPKPMPKPKGKGKGC